VEGREGKKMKTANKLEVQRNVDQMEVQVEQSWKEEKTKKLDATAAWLGPESNGHYLQ
jgi:hypothetical protein